MVDIHSVTAEMKKEERKEEKRRNHRTKIWPAYYIGWPHN